MQSSCTCHNWRSFLPCRPSCENSCGNLNRIDNCTGHTWKASLRCAQFNASLEIQDLYKISHIGCTWKPCLRDMLLCAASGHLLPLRHIHILYTGMVSHHCVSFCVFLDDWQRKNICHTRHIWRTFLHCALACVFSLHLHWWMKTHTDYMWTSFPLCV